MAGFDLNAFVNHDQISVDSVQFVAANVSIAGSFKNYNQAPGDVMLGPMELGYFSASDTEINFKDTLNQVSYTVHRGNFQISEFSSPDPFNWNNLLNYAQSASLDGADLTIPLPDGYKLNVAQYNFQHPESTLELVNIGLSSDFTANEYSKRLTFQKDWFDLKVDSVYFSGLDLQGWLNTDQYRIRKIALDGLDALIYRDKSIPFPADKVRGLPQNILRNLKSWIYLDTLQVKGDITYMEKRTEYGEVGEISFNNLDAYLFNITSVDSMARKPMRLISKGKLMNTANFEIAVLFNMKDPKDQFAFVGEVNNLPLDSMNRLLNPVASINIKSGHSKKIWFNVSANNELAKGEMKLRYSDLKIQILNPETHDTKGLGQGIKTFFANTFVVKSNNPTFLLLRNGKVFYERDPSRAIFHFCGKALLSGAVSSVGINKSAKAERHYSKESGDN